MKIIDRHDGLGQVLQLEEDNVADVQGWFKDHPVTFESHKTTNLLLLGIYSVLSDIRDTMQNDPTRVLKLQELIKEFSDEQ